MSRDHWRPDETLTRSLRRSFHRLTRRIRKLIPKAAEDPEALHEISKAIKRQRALVALAPKPTRGKLDRRLRRWKRPIGPHRDAVVLQALWAEMSARCAEAGHPVPPELCAAWERHAGCRPPALPPATEWDRGIVLIDRSWKRRRFPDEEQDWFFRRLKNPYRQSFRWIGEHLATATDQQLHDLRKLVKLTQHHLEFLAPADPEEIGRLRERHARFAELLGRFHDLSLFDRTLRSRLGDGDSVIPWKPLSECLGAERDLLLRQIREIAPQRFAARPRNFTRRIKRCWNRKKMTNR